MNSGKQQDQKNNLMLLQAVEQARKTENETKSTSKMMDVTQAKGVSEGREKSLHHTIWLIKTMEGISMDLEYWQNLAYYFVSPLAKSPFVKLNQD